MQYILGSKNANLGSTGCSHLVADVDFAFASDDLDMIFSILSTDQGIAVPDARVTVSRILLAGRIRLDLELIPEFPFLGNSTVSFHSVPVEVTYFSPIITLLSYRCFVVDQELDLTVSSFGGIDLSILPG